MMNENEKRLQLQQEPTRELSDDEILELIYDRENYWDDSDIWDDDEDDEQTQQAIQEFVANNPNDPVCWFVLNKDKWYCDGLIHFKCPIEEVPESALELQRTYQKTNETYHRRALLMKSLGLFQDND